MALLSWVAELSEVMSVLICVKLSIWVNWSDKAVLSEKAELSEVTRLC